MSKESIDAIMFAIQLAFTLAFILLAARASEQKNPYNLAFWLTLYAVSQFDLTMGA